MDNNGRPAADHLKIKLFLSLVTLEVKLHKLLMFDILKLLNYWMQINWCTLEHAVISFPVFPPQRLPEARRLDSFIALMDRHFAAAVKASFQRTPGKKTKVN